MFKLNLQSIVPVKLSDFPKITKIGEPYHFKRWDFDKKSNEPILSYWFWNKEKNYRNRKRVFINEFETLLRIAIESGYLLRSDFEKVCPKTNSDGTCGFAVIVAILEYLQVIENTKPGSYSLINKWEIRELLK